MGGQTYVGFEGSGIILPGLRDLLGENSGEFHSTFLANLPRNARCLVYLVFHGFPIEHGQV